MNRRVVPWLFAAVAALAVLAGAQGPAREWTSADPARSPLASVDGAALASSPAAPLLQRENDGGRAHFLGKLGVVGPAAAALALAWSAALRRERATAQLGGHRSPAGIRAPPASRCVV